LLNLKVDQEAALLELQCLEEQIKKQKELCRLCRDEQLLAAQKNMPEVTG
jgi:hypothetical protein